MTKIKLIKKPCNKCGNYERYTANGGCPTCKKASAKIWYENNTEITKARSKAWNKAHPEKLSEVGSRWHKNNSVYHAARTKEWRANNPGKTAEHNNSRRTAKKSARPKWVDTEKIAYYYKLAAWCSKHLGEKYHVDHVVPLQGKNICGLDVEYNLDVITETENLQKSNKF